jgi:hypothetical protein
MAALPSVGLAQPAPGQTRDLEFGQDRFMAGDQVEVTRATDGDVIAAGGRVMLNANVAGDVLPSRGGRIIVAVLALLVLGVLAGIPVAGGLICLAFALVGMGALLLRLWKVRTVS